MKKSDAMDKLQDILIDELQFDFLYCSEDACEGILNRIEKEIGMLPPLQENIDMYTEPYQWEPEDEEN